MPTEKRVYGVQEPTKGNEPVKESTAPDFAGLGSRLQYIEKTLHNTRDHDSQKRSESFCTQLENLLLLDSETQVRKFLRNENARTQLAEFAGFGEHDPAGILENLVTSYPSVFRELWFTHTDDLDRGDAIERCAGLLLRHDPESNNPAYQQKILYELLQRGSTSDDTLALAERYPAVLRAVYEELKEKQTSAVRHYEDGLGVITPKMAELAALNLKFDKDIRPDDALVDESCKLITTDFYVDVYHSGPGFRKKDTTATHVDESLEIADKLLERFSNRCTGDVLELVHHFLSGTQLLSDKKDIQGFTDVDVTPRARRLGLLVVKLLKHAPQVRTEILQYANHAWIPLPHIEQGYLMQVRSAFFATIIEAEGRNAHTERQNQPLITDASSEQGEMVVPQNVLVPSMPFAMGDIDDLDPKEGDFRVQPIRTVNLSHLASRPFGLAANHEKFGYKEDELWFVTLSDSLAQLEAAVRLGILPPKEAVKRTLEACSGKAIDKKEVYALAFKIAAVAVESGDSEGAVAAMRVVLEDGTDKKMQQDLFDYAGSWAFKFKHWKFYQDIHFLNIDALEKETAEQEQGGENERRLYDAYVKTAGRLFDAMDQGPEIVQRFARLAISLIEKIIVASKRDEYRMGIAAEVLAASARHGLVPSAEAVLELLYPDGELFKSEFSNENETPAYRLFVGHSFSIPKVSNRHSTLLKTFISVDRPDVAGSVLEAMQDRGDDQPFLRRETFDLAAHLTKVDADQAKKLFWDLLITSDNAYLDELFLNKNPGLFVRNLIDSGRLTGEEVDMLLNNIWETRSTKKKIPLDRIYALPWDQKLIAQGLERLLEHTTDGKKELRELLDSIRPSASAEKRTAVLSKALQVGSSDEALLEIIHSAPRSEQEILVTTVLEAGYRKKFFELLLRRAQEDVAHTTEFLDSLSDSAFALLLEKVVTDTNDQVVEGFAKTVAFLPTRLHERCSKTNISVSGNYQQLLRRMRMLPEYIPVFSFDKKKDL